MEMSENISSGGLWTIFSSSCQRLQSNNAQWIFIMEMSNRFCYLLLYTYKTKFRRERHIWLDDGATSLFHSRVLAVTVFRKWDIPQVYKKLIWKIIFPVVINLQYFVEGNRTVHICVIKTLILNNLL